MRTNNKSFRVVLAVMVVALLALAWVWWGQTKQLGVWPNEKERTSLKAKARSLEGEIKALQVRLKVRPVLEKLLPFTEKEEALARQVLPSKFAPHELSTAIRDKARQSGIYVQSIVPTTRRAARGAADGDFETITFSLKLEGNYDQISTFINNMENFEQSGPDAEGLRRFFKLSSITLTPRNNGLNDSDPHAATLDMATFRYTGDTAQ